MYVQNKQTDFLKVIINDTVNRRVLRARHTALPNYDVQRNSEFRSSLAVVWQSCTSKTHDCRSNERAVEIAVKLCCTSVDACWQEVRLCSGWWPVPFPQCISSESPTWSLGGGSDLDHRSWASQVL